MGTGKLVFTIDNFERMTKAIKELKIKNIEQESIDKIREDIELTKAKKAKSIQSASPIAVPVQTATVQQVVQVINPVTTSPPKKIGDSSISNKRRIVPKLDGQSVD